MCHTLHKSTASIALVLRTGKAVLCLSVLISYSQTCSTFRTVAVDLTATRTRHGGHSPCLADGRSSASLVPSSGRVFLIYDFKTATCVLALVGQLSFEFKWIALTRCLFLARWAIANFLAHAWVCLICSDPCCQQRRKTLGRLCQAA